MSAERESVEAAAIAETNAEALARDIWRRAATARKGDHVLADADTAQQALAEARKVRAAAVRRLLEKRART